MSETQKHTPTPWRAGEWITGHDGHYVYSLIFGAGKRVASVSVYGKRKDGSDAGKPARFGGTKPTYTQEEVDANRAFIVRAVNAHDDLVKALEPFATFCDGFDGMHRGLARDDDHDIYAFEGRDGLVRITLGDLRRARAALSKAGE
jgi:hypothetical protein